MWRAQPYLREQPVGNGVYVLSEAGRSRFDEFPSFVADDLFVRNQFEVSERYCSPHEHFTIHTPRTLRGLMKMRIRVHRGNAELARAQPHRDLQHGQRMKGLLTSAKSPSALVGVGVYLAVNVTARPRTSARSIRSHANPATRVTSRDKSSGAMKSTSKVRSALTDL